MPYLRIIKKPHECYLPTGLSGKRGGRGTYVGSIWQCPKCGWQWIVEYTVGDKLGWRKMSESEFIEVNNA